MLYMFCLFVHLNLYSLNLDVSMFNLKLYHDQEPHQPKHLSMEH